MKCIEVTAFGRPEVLRVVERAEPTPGPGEVLVRVEAVGLNWSDLMQRAGTYPGGPTPPFITGQEAAGVVVAHGQGVTSPPIGSHVSAIAARGLAAELAIVPAATCIRWEGPADQRAAVPISLLTAVQALQYAHPRETAVIHAAAGALGHIATQVAKKRGLRVIGTASAAKRQYVEADVVCGYDELRVASADGVELVLDGVGGEAFRQSLAVLKPGGRIVIVGAASGEPQKIDAVKLVARSHSVIGLHLRHLLADRGAFERAVLACQQMPVTARVTTMPMEDIAAAHARLEAREVAGKLVLRW